MLGNCLKPQQGVRVLRGVSAVVQENLTSGVSSAQRLPGCTRMEPARPDTDKAGELPTVALMARARTSAARLPPLPWPCFNPSHGAGLHASLLATPAASSLVEQPSRLTSERLRARPALVQVAPDGLQALGLGLPAPALTVQRIAEALGYDYKVTVTATAH